MTFVEAIMAKLALSCANFGAGLASAWSAYQPREPKIMKADK